MAGVPLSQIDFRTLGVFVRVVEHGGVSAAALASGVGVSAVTRDLAGLETRLGLRLCQRGRGGFALTPQGRAVYEAALELLGRVREFETSVAAVRNTLFGALRIGLIDNMFENPDSRVVEALAAVRATSPELQIRISIHPDPEIDTLVRERKLDVAFTGQAQNLASLVYRPAYAERHALFVDERSPHFDALVRAVTRDAGPIDLPYVDRDYEASRFAVLNERFRPNVVAQGATLEAVLACVLAGFGCGVLPIHVAGRHRTLFELPTIGLDLSVPFSILYRRDAVGQPAVSGFLEAYRKVTAVG